MKRLHEIDALRGIAIVAMVIFHFLFDLDYLGVVNLELFQGAWLVFARITQFLFLGLVGASVAFSKRGFKGQLQRGAMIFSLGLLVTLVTWIFAPENFVKFGVLHFIGVAVPLVVFFKRKPWLALTVAFFAFLLGEWLATLTVSNPWMFAIGLRAPGFASLDYFPILPWLAVPLVGLVLGEWYMKKDPQFLKPLGRVFVLTWPGKHSLWIYLLHQPILIAALLLIF